MSLVGDSVGCVPTREEDVHLAEWFASRRRILFIIAAVSAIFWTVLYLQFTVDDALITFRYGWMLVTHHVWNWNPSGPRQEAYTSAVYAVLSILPPLLHLPTGMFFKCIGLFCIVAMVFRLGTAVSTQIAFVLGVLLIGLDPWVWVHAYSGLETPLYMLLLLELGLCVERAPTVSPRYVYALFLLLPLTRPEGIVFAIAGVIAYWFKRREQPKHLAYFVVAVVVGIAYFLARWRYFHQLLPNPFYVKAVHTSAVIIVSNLVSNKGYLLTLLFLLVLARKASTRFLAGCSLFLMLVLFVPHSMAMNFADRYYFQLTLPVLLLFLIAEDLARISRLACVVSFVFLTAISVQDLPYLLLYAPYGMESHVYLARKLSPYAKNHTLLTGDAGAIPYFSDWVSYDFTGLCTSRIARHGLTLPFMRELHPDLILLYGQVEGSKVIFQAPSPRLDAVQNVILDYIHQSGDYQLAGTSTWRDYALVEFLRNDTTQHAEILQLLQANTRRTAAVRISLKDLLEQKYVPWTD